MRDIEKHRCCQRGCHRWPRGRSRYLEACSSRTAGPGCPGCLTDPMPPPPPADAAPAAPAAGVAPGSTARAEVAAASLAAAETAENKVPGSPEASAEAAIAAWQRPPADLRGWCGTAVSQRCGHCVHPNLFWDAIPADDAIPTFKEQLATLDYSADGAHLKKTKEAAVPAAALGGLSGRLVRTRGKGRPVQSHRGAA